MMPVTMVLAGNHREYTDYVKTMGFNAYTANFIEGPKVGVHVPRIVVIGTFHEREDSHDILQYAKICLEIDGKIVYSHLEHTPMKNQKSTATLAYPVNKPPLFSAAGKFQPKVGDIWELPKSNSPMWTQQWGYQGSAKAPYIISRRDEGHANGSTTNDGWACSCMSFTRNTPRTPCKHILNVIVKYSLGVVKTATAKMANVDDAKLKEFEKWQREQAALKAGNNPTAGAKLNLFGATTRKFR
jgi:hypothetical protein